MQPTGGRPIVGQLVLQNWLAAPRARELGDFQDNSTTWSALTDSIIAGTELCKGIESGDGGIHVREDQLLRCWTRSSCTGVGLRECTILKKELQANNGVAAQTTSKAPVETEDIQIQTRGGRRRWCARNVRAREVMFGDAS